MNIQKFTQKSIAAIQGAEKAAVEHGNQKIDQEHLLYALLVQEEGLIPKLITKMEIQLPYFTNSVQALVEKLPKVQGGKAYISQELNDVLNFAEDEAKPFGDEYVSVEHLFLVMLKRPNRALRELFREFGITRDRFLSALQEVRGNQRVTSDQPEDT